MASPGLKWRRVAAEITVSQLRSGFESVVVEVVEKVIEMMKKEKQRNQTVKVSFC